ncbi:hypothetical protein V6V47_01125 [Micromonospora sp. CPCC 205539]|uniref:hypothetical protein n=1 Tax=Micromonospora sp. CPCC 205539 TaxID=3122408 RepID=UPI002FEFF191
MRSNRFHRHVRRLSTALAALLTALAGLVVLPATAAHAAAPARVGDYDGDGKTDAAYFHPDGGIWRVGYTDGAQATLRTGWGEARDEPIPGDYNGDGRADIAVFRPWDGSWSVTYTGGGPAVLKTNWGIQGDIPVPGDYDGDGSDDMMVFRASDGSWSVAYSSGGTTVLRTGWGTLGDIPVSGDYNADGRSDLMVFRPADGSWRVAYTGGGTAALRTSWGNRGDIPVPGDYNGDRRSDMLIYRPATGQWLLGSNGGDNVVLRSTWGGYDDMPVPGDFDGDGSSDLTIFRPRDGSWSVAYTSGGTDVIRVGFGTTGSLSLPASAIPGVPSRTDDLAKPVYFVHGYVLGSGTDCNNSYWANAVADFRLDGDPAFAQTTRTVGFYQGDRNCDVRIAEGSHDTGIEELGRLFSWEIYNRYSRFGVAVDVVAHSMGGLIAMTAISGTQRNLVGWAPYVFVEDVSTLATPFAGISSVMAIGCGAFTYQCSQMSANSAFYRNWSANNPQADGTGTDWTLIGSYDDIVVSEGSATAMGNPGHKILYYQRLPNDESVGHGSITELTTGAYSHRTCDHYRSCDMNTSTTWPSTSSLNDPVFMARLGSYRYNLG